MTWRRRRPEASVDEEVMPSGSTRRGVRWIGGQPWPQLAVFATVAAMSVAAVAGLHPAFAGWGFLAPLLAGAIGATTVTMIARARHLLLGEAVAASVVGLIVLGGPAVGGAPTVGAYRDFVAGLMNAWADFLSTPAPADLTAELRVVPYTLAWLAAGIGTEIARHTRRPWLGAIGPLLGLGLTLLFTVFERPVALWQGTAMVAGAVALVGLGERAAGLAVAGDDDIDTGGRTSTSHRLRIGLGACVVIGAVGAAPWLGPRLPLADAHERFDLRQYQQPPFDPLALPSPLVQVKANLKEPRRDDAVFSVTGPPVTLLPVATMTDYDGVVWTVGDPDRNRSDAEFSPVGSQLPPLERTIPEDAPLVTHHFEIADQGGHFLPTAGSPTALTVAESAEPYLNLTTGTIALRSRLGAGFSYDVTSAVPPALTDEQLESVDITLVDRSAELELLPPSLRNIAADLTAVDERGWPEMAAIRDAFVGDLGNESAGGGFYDIDDTTPPGHSYGRLEEMLADPDRIVGFEEQYAAAAAVLGRVLQLPTRVVVGYRIPDGEWTSADVPLDVPAAWTAAWVEIDAGSLGWVPVLVTPDRNHTIDQRVPAPSPVPVVVPNPPPPPPPPPDVSTPRQVDDTPETDETVVEVHHRFGGDGPGLVTVLAIGATGIPVIIFVVFAAVVMSWKALRRHRRRRHATAAGRVAGAWAEASDRAIESGAPLASAATPREAVQAYASVRVDDGEAVVRELDVLVRHLDRAVYAAAAPSDEQVDQAWLASDRLGRELRGRRSMPERLRMRIDPRPLRRDTTTTGARS
ncbi:MAG: transglutaminase domain-containing protein [Desertimonas sp.]